MNIGSLVDIICACHLSSYVDSPFKGLGGLMLVGPPEAFKTTMLSVLHSYPNALMLSDINTQGLTKMRDQIASGSVRTLALLDWQKLYERDSDTAANVEGNLRALACEGFSSASFQNSEINRVTAHAVIMGAMTPGLVETRYDKWKATGFARRFLFSLFVLDDPEMLTRAIVEWEHISLGARFIPPPITHKIPFTVTKYERERLLHAVRYQYGKTEPLHTLCKILAVLKWHYRSKPAKAGEVMRDFVQSLTREGTRLTIGDINNNGVSKKSASRSRVRGW